MTNPFLGPGGGDRVTYEYWLEHVSAAMGPDAQLKEAPMINDLHARLEPESLSEADLSGGMISDHTNHH